MTDAELADDEVARVATEFAGLLLAAHRSLAVADAGRRWAAAEVALATSERRPLELLLELEAAAHELVIAAGYPCPYCSAGDCPGGIGADLDPLDLEGVVDVEVDGRL